MEHTTTLLAPLVKPPPARKQQNDLDEAQHYLNRATKKEVAKKGNPVKKEIIAGKVALGIILKETTGLRHLAIAHWLNRVNPVATAKLINKESKA